jgi:hypothetical protein
MGLVENMKKKPAAKKAPASTTSDRNKLDQEELIVILNLVRQSTFKGEDIERVYNTVLKLQNQLKDVSNQS